MTLARNISQSLSSQLSRGLAASSAQIFLNNLLTGVLFEWDGGVEASYPGTGQTIANLTPSPADGESQTTYDCELGIGSGSGTDDPTFDNGDFDFDGGDRISLVGPNTAFINNIHKTNQTDLEVTFILPIFWPASVTTGEYYLFGTNNSATDTGFYFSYRPANQGFLFRQYGGGGSTAPTTIGTGITLNGDAWNFIVFGFQKTSGTAGNWTLRVNGTTTQTGSLATFLTGTADPGDPFQISGVAGTNLLPNGTSLRSFAMVNNFLTEQEIGSVLNLYGGRHNRLAAYTAT